MALRALVSAHAQSAWNRSTRQLTRRGRNIALAVVGFVFVFGTGAFGTLLALLGWFAGQTLDGRGLVAAGALLFALSWGIGLLFGITGTGRLLEVGQLKGYPVRPLTTLLAELVARLVEPITAAVAIAMLAFVGGLVAAQPERAPRLLLLAGLQLFVLLAMQFIMGELLQAVARRARLALVVMTVLSLGMSPRVVEWLEQGSARGFERFERIAALVQLLPTTQLLGAEAGMPVVWPLLQSLLGPGVLLALGLWVMSREQAAKLSAPIERESGLWTFEAPAAGIARLQLATFLRSPVGRYSLMAPLFAMVLVPWMMQLLFATQRSSFAVFLYASLGTTQLHFNMFGLEGPSVGDLLRLPLPARTLLWGKNAAVLVLALVEGAVLALFLRVVRGEPVDLCVAGLCIFAAVNFFMAAVGRFVSVQWPRTMPRTGARGAAPPLPVVLVNMFSALSITGGLGGSLWLVFRFAPQWLLPASAALAVAAAGVFFGTLPVAARFLEARREHVLLAMK